MNKELVVEYLYDIFDYALTNNHNPVSFFPSLCEDEDFINMIEGKPFDNAHLLGIIDTYRKADLNIDTNQIRYLSFVISEFLDRTLVDAKSLSKYIDVKDIFNNFNYYHSQDINWVIFIILTKHNMKYRLRKSNKEAFVNEDNLLNNFLRLYPLKSFVNPRLIFDNQTAQSLYINDDNEMLLYNHNPLELLKDDYFIKRYLIGNKAFCFTDSDLGYQDIDYPTTIYFLIIKEDGITLLEPSGMRCVFLFSN